MNRGSQKRADRSGTGLPSFNEAPIHESGKFHGFQRHSRMSAGASMRPRFMNRGSSYVFGDSWPVSALQ